MENIIKESLYYAIKKVINEDSINAKKRNNKSVISTFVGNKKNRYHGIKSFAVFTAENPDSQEAPRQFNRRQNRSLKKDLRYGGYTTIPVEGHWFGNPEHSYLVVNIPLETCKSLNGKYQQTSFVYSEIGEDNKLHSQYFEKNDAQAPYDATTNDYKVKDTSDKWVNQRESDDGYTVIGKKGKFKYSIPFSIFENVNKIINDNLDNILIKENKDNNAKNKDMIIEFASRKQGQSPYLWRKALYKGLL